MMKWLAAILAFAAVIACGFHFLAEPETSSREMTTDGLDQVEGERRAARRTKSGDTSPGSESSGHEELEIPPRGWGVTARLVGDDGEALVQRKIEFTFGTSDIRKGTTDAKGRLSLVFTVHERRPPPGTALCLRTAGGGDDALYGAGDAAEERAEPVQDFGDIRLKRLPVLLAGRVVDPDGRGVEKVRLVFKPFEEATLDEGPVTSETGDDGHFEVRASWSRPREGVWVIAMGETILAKRQELTGGRLDHVIPVTLAGRVAVPFRTPNDVRAGTVRIFPVGSHRPEARGYVKRDEEAGCWRAEFEDVPVGRYEARIDFKFSTQVAGLIEVRAGETAETPMLEAGQAFRILRVRARTPAGEIIRVHTVAQCGKQTIRSDARDEDIILPRGPCRLTIKAQGSWREEVIDDPPDVVDVTLRPCIPVTFVTDAPLREACHFLVYVGEGIGGARLEPDARSAQATVVRHGTMELGVSVRIPIYGERLVDQITKKTRREVIGYEEYDVSPEDATVTILDTQAGQTVRVPVDAALLAEVYRQHDE